MAPALDGLPAAEREVEVSGAVAGRAAGGAAPGAPGAGGGPEGRVRGGGERHTRDTSRENRLAATASFSGGGGLTTAEARPPIPVPVARAVGGTTVINSGTCF